jgi:hypothetical protein
MRGAFSRSIPALALLLAGCCTAAPDGEKYFDRSRSAAETVRLFRYSVEAKQYGAAYRCLCAGFRAKHTEREFSLAVRYGSFEGRGLRDFILEADQDSRTEPIQGLAPGRAQWVTLVFFLDPEDAATDSIEHSLFVLFEDGEWRIDPETNRPQQEQFFRDLSRDE